VNAPINAKIPAEKFAVGSIVAVAAFLRFYRLGEKQLWLDELLQVIHSSPHQLNQLLLAITKDRGATPLDYLVQHLFVALLGHSESAVRFHAALFGTLSVVVVYLLTRDLLDRRTACLASLLYAVYPLHHHYSQEGRPYSLFTFLTLCSYVAFLKLLRTNNLTRQVCYGLITTLLLYSSYFGFWVILWQLVMLGFLRHESIRANFGLDQQSSSFKAFVLPIVASLILFAPWPILAWKTVYGYQTSPWKLSWDVLPVLVREISDRSYPLSVILIGLATLGAVALRTNKLGQLVLLLCWFLLPIPLIILTVWHQEYFFATRQILFTTPALYILVACGILSLPELLRLSGRARCAVKTLAVSTVVITSLIVIALHTPDKREDIKGVATFLDERATAQDVIIAPVLSDFIVYYFPHLNPQFRNITTLSDTTTLTGKKIFIVDSRYATDEDRRLTAELTNQTEASRTRRSDFRGNIQVIELWP
jgi:mannosyltransferase